MKIWLRHTLLLAIIVIFCTGSLVIRRACLAKDRLITCSGIEITMEGSNEYVSKEDILQHLSQQFGELKGCRLDSISLSKVERTLNEHGAILGCQVWSTTDSILHISVEARRPAARFARDNGDFYVDKDGFIFHLNPVDSIKIPVMEGRIPVDVDENFKGPAASEDDRMWINAALRTLLAINGSDIWDTFPIVTVDDNQDIVIRRREGGETIMFGQPEYIEDKISSIGTYYSKIKPSKPEGYYNTVNLKYYGQIVCRQ